MKQAESMHSIVHERNPLLETAAGHESSAQSSHQKMSAEEMRAELTRREGLLQQPPPGKDETNHITNPWRVYREIIAAWGSDVPLRMFIQASAGTGKPIGHVLDELPQSVVRRRPT